MKAITKTMAAMALWGLQALTGNASWAMPTVSLVAQSSALGNAQELLVDVRVSGLQSTAGQTVLGGFDLQIHFDTQVLQLASPPLVWGTALGSPFDAAQTFQGLDDSAAGVLRIFEVSLLESGPASCLFCTGPFLEDLQGDAFDLATVMFRTLPNAAAGAIFTTISLRPGPDSVLSDAFGNNVDGASFNGTTVQVPEPSAAWLLLAALAAAGWAQTRARKRRDSTGVSPTAPPRDFLGATP